MHRSQAYPWAYQTSELPQFDPQLQPGYIPFSGQPAAGYYAPQQYMQQYHEQQLFNPWGQQQQHQYQQAAWQPETGHAAPPSSPTRQPTGMSTPPTSGSQMQMQMQMQQPPPPPAAPVLPMHGLEDPDKPPPPTEKGCPLQPRARMFEAADLEEDPEGIILVGGARHAKRAEGVAVRLSAPGNSTFLKTSEVLQSVQAALTRKHIPLTLLSEEVKGQMTGPYLLSMAAHAAQRLLEDEVLKVFSGRDGGASVEFEVHLLNTKGSKYKEEGTEAAVASQRGERLAQSEAARASRNGRTFRMYLEYPDTHGNMDLEAQRQLEARVRQHTTSHLESHGAAEVGHAHTFDDQDYRLPKETMWVTHPEDVSLLEFCCKSLPGLKYFDVSEPQLVKANLTKDTLEATGLKRCCFLRECVAKSDGGACGAAERAYKARGGERSGAAERVKKLEQREKRSTDRGHERESRGSVVQQRVAADQEEKGQECRSYLKGRCTRLSGCERHTTPSVNIMCCSSRKQGDLGFKPKLDKCRFDLASCPFKGHVG